MKIIQGTKKVAIGMSLLGLLGFSNKALSQNTKKINSGVVEVGKVINKNTKGIKVGIYLFNSKFQIGYTIEDNLKSNPLSVGKGIDLLKAGIETNYFPLNTKFIKPYLGSGVKYEHESYFVGEENKYYKKDGLGLEMKLGTELKPLRKSKVKLFFDLEYNLPFDKKSEGYPENPEIKRDKFTAVAGLKF